MAIFEEQSCKRQVNITTFCLNIFTFYSIGGRYVFYIFVLNLNMKTHAYDSIYFVLVETC